MTSPDPLRPPPTSLAPDRATIDYAGAFAVCAEKARRNVVRLAARPTAGTWAVDGDYFANPEGFFDIGNWTTSFFTGMALLAFDNRTDGELLESLRKLGPAYHDKVTRHRMDTMHDLGFLYSLYSVAMYRLTGEGEHRATGLLAAGELAKRYSAIGGYIQAWGRMDDTKTDYAGLAIVDCLMNLPLLFWAAGETGNRFFAEIALRHADTTLKYFVRPDDSVYHAFRFDVQSGGPTGPDNYCGYTVDSHWARGTAWATYGFALAYRHTRHARYLDAALRIAQKFCALLDLDEVPVWDFKLPTGQPRLRDSSAAAIAVCAFDEIQVHRFDSGLRTTAEALLRRLCRAEYLDPHPDCPGVLRQGEVGDGWIPGTRCLRAKNVYASWGDYFFMEALARRIGTPTFFW